MQSCYSKEKCRELVLNSKRYDESHVDKCKHVNSIHCFECWHLSKPTCLIPYHILYFTTEKELHYISLKTEGKVEISLSENAETNKKLTQVLNVQVYLNYTKEYKTAHEKYFNTATETQ